MITGLPVAEVADSMLVSVDETLSAGVVVLVLPLNVSVSPSLVIVVCTLGIRMVLPLWTTSEGPMIKVVWLLVIVVDEEAGIVTVDPRMTAVDARPVCVGDSVVTCVMVRVVEGCGDGAVEVMVLVWVVLAGSVLSRAVIVVKLVIEEPGHLLSVGCMV